MSNVTTTTDHRTHPLDLYLGLVAALTGTTRGCRLSLAVIDVLSGLDATERDLLAAFAARCQEAHAAWCLTTEDVAQRLRVSERTAQRLARSGALPGLLASGHWRFTEQQLTHFAMVHAYVNGERIHPDTPAPLSDRVDTDRLAEARAQLGDGDWTTRQLAGVLGISNEAAYLLVLGWHSIYAVNHLEKRGWYRFAELPA